MPLQTNIAQWGSSLAVRIPQNIADDVGITEGTSVELSLDGNVLSIQKTNPDLDENIASKDPDIRP